jgi:hypothetical protein
MELVKKDMRNKEHMTCTVVEEIKSGEIKPLIAWLEFNKTKLYRIGWNYLYNNYDIEDVLHNTLVKVYTNIKKLKQCNNNINPPEGFSERISYRLTDTIISGKISRPYRSRKLIAAASIAVLLTCSVILGLFKSFYSDNTSGSYPECLYWNNTTYSRTTVYLSRDDLDEKIGAIKYKNIPMPCRNGESNFLDAYTPIYGIKGVDGQEVIAVETDGRYTAVVSNDNYTDLLGNNDFYFNYDTIVSSKFKQQVGDVTILHSTEKEMYLNYASVETYRDGKVIINQMYNYNRFFLRIVMGYNITPHYMEGYVSTACPKEKLLKDGLQYSIFKLTEDNYSIIWVKDGIGYDLTITRVTDKNKLEKYIDMIQYSN